MYIMYIYIIYIHNIHKYKKYESLPLPSYFLIALKETTKPSQTLPAWIEPGKK